MLEVLSAREFPTAELVPFASERSAGRELPGAGTVVALREDTIAGFDIALFSAGGGTSREWAPRFAAAGAVVVDNSSAWRMDPQVPLVVSEVNPDALARIERGIVANPNCTTMVIMLPLKALHDTFGLRGIVATSFQAAGGAGQKGMDELAAQVPIVHDARQQLVSAGAQVIAAIEHSIHAAPLAYNVVPWLGSPAADGYSDEELKLVNESRKILDLPGLQVSPTCVRVPVMVGHCIQLRASFERPVDHAAALAALEAFPGVVLDELPTPVKYAGRDEVAVGRVRSDLGDPHSLNLFVVGDNLLKGAALNAVQIAELLVERGLLGRRVAATA
jgi:aspartate-semialdehyde dehydrogenase